MHRPSTSSSSSSSMFKSLLFVLVTVVVFFAITFMWCYTDRMSLTREVAKLRKDAQIQVASALVNAKQVEKVDEINKKAKQEESNQKKNIKSSLLPRSVSHMVYRVVVFTYLRPEGLKRLLASLKNSYYPRSATVSLTILVDYPKPTAFKGKNADENKKAREETISLINNFKWKNGPFVVHRRQANVGLKRNILESWYPSTSSENENNEVSILLEDDIEVSPFWFDWATAAVEKYYFQEVVDKKNDKILGVSLYRPIHDEQSRRSCVVDDSGGHHDPFLLQQPCSWGAIYFPHQWRAFRDWYDEFDAAGEEPIVVTERNEEPDANTWAKASSWKKYLIRHMHESGWGMIYPNLPDRLVYSTNHLMKGEHPTPNRKLFELPLLDVENAKKIWPGKSDVIEAMMKRITGQENHEKDEEEGNTEKNEEFLSILMNKGNSNNNNNGIFVSDVLPELGKLRSFDVMFNEEKGGASQLLQPKKNLANPNADHRKQQHHH